MAGKKRVAKRLAPDTEKPVRARGYSMEVHEVQVQRLQRKLLQAKLERITKRINTLSELREELNAHLSTLE